MASKQELWDAGQEIVLASPVLYIDVDVEADGIAGYGSMLSIGAQSPTGEHYYSEIKPRGTDYISSQRQFCEAHGLEYDRLLAEAPDLDLVMKGFKRWVGNVADKYKKQPVFTAFNAAFDWAHVDLSFVRSGITENPFGIAPFDLKSLAVVLSPEWDFSQTTKSKLPPEIVPDTEFTHHALEDARFQQKLHFGMAAILGSARYSAATKTR